MNKVLFLLAMLLMFDMCHAATPAVERPTYSEGDYWVYTVDDRDVKITFVREEKDRYIFEKGGTHVVKDFNLIPVRDKSGGFPGLMVKFPLTAGKWWDFTFEADDTTSKRESKRIAKYVVESYDQITVPAGTLWAFKITFTIVEGKFGHTMKSGAYWYSPEVKNIIKSSFKGEPLELKRYKVK